MSEWETFCDRSYYDLWRVRRKNERGFNDGYHLHNGEEARALVELLNGLERERYEEREERVKWMQLSIDADKRFAEVVREVRAERALADRWADELEAECDLADQLANALKMTRWDSPVTCKAAITAWKEARRE